MKRFKFMWRDGGVVCSVSERLASFRAAECRARAMAEEVGVEVLAFWQGWSAKGQPSLSIVEQGAECSQV